jgi:PAS domain S-box-containing protein
MSNVPASPESEIATLREELAELREALEAIRTGAVDALVLSSETNKGWVFTLEGSDFPYRLLVEQMREGAAILDLTGNILYANRSLATLLQRPLQSLMGIPFHEFFLEPDDDWVRGLCSNCVVTGREYHTDALITGPDGAPTPVTVSFHLFEAYGSRTLSVTVVDLTEHLALARAEAKREATNALKASEKRYRELVEFSPEPIAVNANGRWIFGNKAALEMFGARSPEAFAGIPVLDLIDPAYRAEIAERLRRTTAERGHRTAPKHFRVLRLDGRSVDVETTAIGIEFEGRPATLVVLRDITERKRSEEALRESEARFRLALKNSPVSVAIQDRDQVFQWAYNQRTWDTEQIVGKRDHDLFSAEDAEWLKEIKGEVLKSGTEIRVERWLTSHGQRVFVDLLLQPMRDASGQITGIGLSTVNLTDKKLLEDALKESQERYFLIHQKAPFGISLVRLADGVHVEVNEKWEALTGFSRAEALGRTAMELGLLADFEAWADVLERLNSLRSVHDLEFPFTSKSGESKAVRINLDIVSLSGVDHALTTLEDITERKQVEERLQRILESIGDGFFACDSDWRFVYVNKEAERVLGIDRITVLGQNHWEVFPLTVGTSLEREYRRAAAGEPRDFENYYEPWKRWFHNRCFPREGGGMAVYFADITERKLAEEELARHQAMLRTIMEASEDCIYLKDSASRMLYVNPSTLRLLGKTSEELIGHTDEELYEDPTISSEILKHDRQTMATGIPHVFDETIESARGRRIMHSSKMVWRDGQGRVMGTMGISRDITEQRNSEEIIRLSEERYRTLFSSLLEGFCLIEMVFDEAGKPLDFRFLDYNPAFERQTGFRDVKGKLVSELVPDLEAFWFETYGKVALSGEPAHFVNETQSMRKWFDVSAFRIDGEEGRKVAVLFSDITERKRTEDLLEQRIADRTSDLNLAIQTLRMIMNCHQVIARAQEELDLVEQICRIVRRRGGYRMAWVGFAEPDGEKLVWPVCWDGVGNDYLQKIRVTWADGPDGRGPTGSCIRLREARLNRDFETAPEMAPWREQALLNGFRSSLSLPLIWEDQIFGALTIYAGKPDGFDQDRVILLADLAKDLAFGIMSIRSRCERDQAKALAEYRADMLRTLAAELVQAEQREREKLVKILHDHVQQLLVAAKYGIVSLAGKMADENAQKMRGKIEDTLDQAIQASRSLSAELSPPILHEKGLLAATKWLSRQMLERHGLTVEIISEKAQHELEPQYSAFLFDAIRELLFNVVKHSGVSSARVYLVDVEGGFEVTVEDDGTGFDAGRIDVRRSEGGGLGLFSIRERLGYLGGQLQVDSSPDSGTRIKLITPFGAAPKTPVHEIKPEPKRSLPAQPHHVLPLDGRRKVRILLADDHLVVRQGLVGLLEDQPDFEVVAEASNGEEALELAHRHHPDVVVMDITMPKMDGIEATRRITQELPGIAVIGLSMHEDPAIAHAIREVGALGFVTKGGASEELISAVRAVSRVAHLSSWNDR